MSPTGLRVKELRLAKGLSQPELSRLAKVRQATISTIEAGKARRIDLAALERLADALDVAAADLIVTLPSKRRK